MTFKNLRNLRAGLWISSLLILVILPGMIFAQPIFTFNVVNMESYDRTGNWIWDADNPGMNLFLQQDGEHFTYNLPSPHYFSEKYIHEGNTPGKVTTITCIAENTPLADNPVQIALTFTQFELVSFRRINTVNPANPWNTPGQAGDIRIYSNASGYISYNGNPVLYMNNATFVITTPYPNQAQIRALNPAVLGGWIGDIGTGLLQTGYGFGELDLAQSDDAWEALFASSDYKIRMDMGNLIPDVGLTTTWHNFVLNISPADPPYNGFSNGFNPAGLPLNLPFPDQNVNVNLIGGTTDESGGSGHYFFVNEILQTPAGALPPGFTTRAKKYWEIGTTLKTFTANISFSLSAPGDFELAKTSADWKVLYQPESGVWTEWADYTVIDPFTIRANGVTESFMSAKFTVASTVDETLPVELSSFTATVNAQNLITLAWSTASETSMIGFNVYYKPIESPDPIVLLTPNAIPASNNSYGANYSFSVQEVNTPGSYNFYLEAISMDGTSQFYGPVHVTLTETEVPPLPERTMLSDAWPNPFNIGNSTNIQVTMKAGENGMVSIYNLAGQVVKTFKVNQGMNNLSWNGLDNKGNLCASGVYFYKLTSPSLNQTKKLMLVK